MVVPLRKWNTWAFHDLRQILASSLHSHDDDDDGFVVVGASWVGADYSAIDDCCASEEVVCVDVVHPVVVEFLKIRPFLIKVNAAVELYGS